MGLNITTNYAGKSATEYISAALFAGESFEKGLIYPVTNVKHKMALPRFDFDSNLIQLDSAVWTSGGTLSRTEKYLQPVKMKVNFEHDIYQFEDSWESDRLSPGAQNGDYPAELSNYINDLAIGQVNQQIEIAIWASNWSGASATSLSGYNITGMYGLLKKIDDDSPNRVNGTTLSSSNIQTELAKVYNAIPAQLKDQSVICMSKTALGYYFQSQASQASIGNVAIAQQPTYLGIPVYGLAGFPTNVMAAFVPANKPKRNCFAGTDLLSDLQSIKIVDLRESLNVDQFRYKMRFMLDLEVGYGAETVLYK